MERYEGTFLTLLQDWRRHYGDRPALYCDGQCLSFRELSERAEMAAAVMQKAGLTAGESVVIWGGNSIEWALNFLAVTAAGGTAVLMNYGIRAAEAAKLANMAGADWILYGTITGGQERLLPVGTMAQQAGIPWERCWPFSFAIEERVSEEEREMFLTRAASSVNCRNSQVIIYTTGTTGEPKAVQLSAYSILNDAHACYELLQEDIGRSVCNALPLFHSYGLLILFAYLSCGRTVYLPPILKPDKIAALLCEQDIDDLASVGTIYELLSRLPQAAELHLNIGIVGGGFTSPAEMIRLEKSFGSIKMLCGYGQTECSPVISVERATDPLPLRAHSVGHILPGLSVRIVDKEGNEVSSGETGEIVIKGYCTMNGYYGRAAQEDPFDADGWLHTGDIGRKIGEDMLQLTGRLKEIIVRGGENVSPTEVEQVLLSLPHIRGAAVIGRPHPIWGESVEACVVWEYPLASQQEQERIAEDILQQLRQELSSYKVPSHLFFFEQFPLTATGKTDKRALAEALRC